MGSVPTPTVDGWVAPGLEPVRDAFADNFATHGEVGAAFAVSRQGTLLADLWGGLADPATGRRWERDTLQLVFSGSKGLVAGCLLLLIDRGQLALEEPVARYWPEFAAGGKDGVLVRDLVSHTSRLPAFQVPVGIDDLLDDRRMAGLLAMQPPDADPRAKDVYHCHTYGWLCGELVRRVDGRSVGRFFHDELAEPLGLELWIGLPHELESRVATIVLDSDWGVDPEPGPDRPAIDRLVDAVRANPPYFGREELPWNRHAFHAAEIPALNAIGTARSIARFYDALEEVLSRRTAELARVELSRRHDPVFGQTMAFGVGFQLQTDSAPYGPPADAFGHGGAGGSVHGRWPGAGVGFSYTMNLLRGRDVDPRAAALLEALHGCLDPTTPTGGEG